jgi:hypothetical protein
MKESKYPTRLFEQYAHLDREELDELEALAKKDKQMLSIIQQEFLYVGQQKNAEEQNEQKRRFENLSREQSMHEFQIRAFKNKLAGSFYTPEFVIVTIIDILSKCKFESALDPWARSGLILTSLIESEIVKKGKGICIQKEEFEFAKKLGEGLNVEWEFTDPRHWISTNKEQYDIIVCHPPWGLQSTKDLSKPIQIKGLTDSDDALLILKSCEMLKSNGIGIFVVPKRFVFGDRPNSVYANLNKFGLALDAFLAIPAQSFLETSIGGGIAIIRKSDPIPIFTGLVSADTRQRKRLIDNLHKRRSDKDVIYGTLVNSADFRGFDDVEKQDRTNRIGKKFGYPATPISEIIVSVNLPKPSDQPFQEYDNSVYLPIIGTSPAITSSTELVIKPQNYIQLTLDPLKADAEYIAGLFNSPFGKILREQGLSGSVIPKLAKRTIGNMTVFLPPVTQQKVLVDADRKTRTIENDVRSIRDQLWSEPRKINTLLPKLERLTREESFKEWLDGLPFPLASILWTYNAAGKDEKLRYEHLLHFFEATAAFMATIQLSAVKRDEQLQQTILPDLLERLKKQNIQFSRASFGTWQTTYANLAKSLRQLNDKPESREKVYQLLKTHDPEVISLLTSKELSSLFEQVNVLRNKWPGHGGVVGHHEAIKRHEILKKHLISIQHIFGSLWDRYQLVYPMEMRYSKGKFHQNIQKISGTSIPFEQANLDLEIPLEEGFLYLVGLGEREALCLLPFVRLQSPPNSAINACYFFSRQGRGGLRYISYHFDVNSEIEEELPDVAIALKGLLENGDLPTLPE